MLTPKRNAKKGVTSSCFLDIRPQTIIPQHIAITLAYLKDPNTNNGLSVCVCLLHNCVGSLWGKPWNNLQKHLCNIILGVHFIIEDKDLVKLSGVNLLPGPCGLGVRGGSRCLGQKVVELGAQVLLHRCVQRGHAWPTATDCFRVMLYRRNRAHLKRGEKRHVEENKRLLSQLDDRMSTTRSEASENTKSIRMENLERGTWGRRRARETARGSEIVIGLANAQQRWSRISGPGVELSHAAGVPVRTAVTPKMQSHNFEPQRFAKHQ